MSGTSAIGYWEAIAPAIALALIAFALLPWLNRYNTVARTGAILISLFFAWRYMSWRILYTLPPVGLTFDFALGFVFIVVELLSMTGASIALFFLTRTRDRSREADDNIAWLKSLSRPPLTDILICTVNEEKAILERTMIGALGIDYPNYRVWVCDDGRRQWLKEMCDELGCGYITRDENRNAKAGNINNALRYLSTLDTRPDFVAILDADFVPKKEFLTRTLALMREPDVGVVQTPQHFYNPDPIQKNLSLSRVWPDEQRYFFDIVMASKDAWGGAFCCGTSSLLRFAPLMQVKKFPTDSVTEDYLVSLRLKEIGYRTIYLNEPLSLGLAPEGLKEYISQRSRWALGFMQICRGPSGPLSLTSHAPLQARIMLIETFLFWSATHLFRLLALIIPAAYLWLHIQAVYAYVPDAIYHLLPYLVVEIAVMRWLTKSRVLPIMIDVSQLLVATDIARSVVVGLIHPKGHKFDVTAKGGDRSTRFVQWPMLRIFLVYLAITIGGVLWAFLIEEYRPLAEASMIALIWSWYNIFVLTLACFVCIEAPQISGTERFRGTGQALLTINGRKMPFPVSEISLSSLRLQGPVPGAYGTPVGVHLDDLDVEGRIVRAYKDGFAIEFATSKDAHERVIRHVYGRHYSAQPTDIDSKNVVAAMVARVFR